MYILKGWVLIVGNAVNVSLQADLCMLPLYRGTIGKTLIGFVSILITYGKYRRGLCKGVFSCWCKTVANTHFGLEINTGFESDVLTSLA